MTISLLGLQIANGYSPEARVFAGLLAHADPSAVAAQVLFQQGGQSGQKDAADSFRAASGAAVQPLDFGWRSVAADRSLSDKMRARMRFFAALPPATAQARRLQPDVVYSCQQLWDCQAATYIARKLKRPQVIHLHYIVGPWLHPPVLRRLLTCDHVVTVSDFIREEALRHGVAPEKVTTVRNALAVPPPTGPQVREEVRRELGIAPEAPLLGIVARLDPEKGQLDTLRAFAAARRACPEARLLVVGDETPWHPGYAARLKQEADTLGLEDSALFLGRRTDVPRLLAALDIFVHPARREPFGLAMAEACVAGLPVLGYAEGGACEIVEEGVTGLLAPPGSADELAARMTFLLADPEKGRRMGAAGRARMEAHFRPEESSRRLQAVLQTV